MNPFTVVMVDSLAINIVIPIVSKWRVRLPSLGFKQMRRVVVFVVGMTVFLLGIALLVLPGPAVLVIPAGLAILGLEFQWARRWMRRARAAIRSGETRFFRRGRKAGDYTAKPPCLDGNEGATLRNEFSQPMDLVESAEVKDPLVK